jgi:mRNA interferase ChpB
MKRGDIYLASMDPAAGHEQQGRRPVLIISPTSFNRLARAPVILPISTKGGFARERGFTVGLAVQGMKTQGVILCHQPRVLDLQAREARWIEAAPSEIVEEALAKLTSILE